MKLRTKTKQIFLESPILLPHLPLVIMQITNATIKVTVMVVVCKGAPSCPTIPWKHVVEISMINLEAHC